MILIYKICVQPKIEYACQVWNDAADSFKSKHLDVLQHAVLCRVFRVPVTASREALEVEAGIPPLELRREYLTARAYRRIASCESAVSVLLRSHASRTIDTLELGTNQSFFLRGERLINTRFRGRCLRHDMINCWQQQWDDSRLCRQYHEIQPVVSLAAKKWQKKFRPSLLCAVSGMRVQTPPLRVYRNKVGMSDSSLCECGQPESTDHFWLSCPRYSEARTELIRVFRQVFPLGSVFLTRNILTFDQKGLGFYLWICAVRRFISSTGRLKTA